jgi:hypothetical protein
MEVQYQQLKDTLSRIPLNNFALDSKNQIQMGNNFYGRKVISEETLFTAAEKTKKSIRNDRQASVSSKCTKNKTDLSTNQKLR